MAKAEVVLFAAPQSRASEMWKCSRFGAADPAEPQNTPDTVAD